MILLTTLVVTSPKRLIRQPTWMADAAAACMSPGLRSIKEQMRYSSMSKKKDTRRCHVGPRSSVGIVLSYHHQTHCPLPSLFGHVSYREEYISARSVVRCACTYTWSGSVIHARYFNPKKVLFYVHQFVLRERPSLDKKKSNK